MAFTQDIFREIHIRVNVYFWPIGLGNHSIRRILLIDANAHPASLQTAPPAAAQQT
jgi:hypothetical protein